MRLGKKRIWLLAVLMGLPSLALAWAWQQRVPIAKDFLKKSLVSRGIPATYVIKQIGTKRQRIEKIVIGDPEKPDATADWAEIDTSVWLFGYEIRAVRAHGVRIRGKVIDGQLKLGAVDKLLPASKGEPFKFPNLPVSLTDARASIITPNGAVVAVLSGSGNFARDFNGRIAIASPELRVSSARLLGVTSRFAATIQGDVINAVGPIEVENIHARGVTLKNVNLTTSILANLALGNADVRTKGNTAIGSASVVKADDARFEVSVKLDRRGLQRANGPVWLNGLRPPPGQIAKALQRIGAFGGTPLEPIGEQLRSAIGGLERGGDAELRLDCNRFNTEIGCTIEPRLLLSHSGLMLRGKDARISLFPGIPPRIEGRYAFSGGGLPGANVMLSGTANDLRFSISPLHFTAKNADLTLSAMTGGYRGGSVSLDTNALISGPVGAGRVRGLSVPIALGSGKQLLGGCFTPRIESFRIQSLALDPVTLRLCRDGNAFAIGKTRVNGSLGNAPVTISTSGGQIAIPSADFAFREVAIQLAARDTPTSLNLLTLDGTLGRGGAKGRYTGVAGRIGNVPLLLSDGQGQWLLNDGVFSTRVSLKIADAEPSYRFAPLFSPDFDLKLSQGRIAAGGTLLHPKSGVPVSKVKIAHDLGTGTGQALLDVQSLEFGEALQPEELTPITLGVVANVKGRINGLGAINWSGSDVRSNGTFSTEGVDLAAAFGPVEGLKGTITLTDLLGLETSDIQSVSLASINPGIAVIDGDIKYRLLPGRRVEILGGRWPFAGGFLLMEPATLDLSQEKERRLTFRVEGIDIARFIAAMQFDNISATGMFDGLLPMVFDATGGRIEGGKLQARGGGTLSYIGEISNQSMSPMAQFAFDALRSLKYKRLSIDMDGAIDGDVITRISFAGVNQQPLGVARAKLPIPVKVTGLDNIPFIFNVKITAKFRQLFEMARSFNDPSLLINRIVPQLEPSGIEAKDPEISIQPAESGKKP
jgi:translocation and assembly module TamB